MLNPKFNQKIQENFLSPQSEQTNHPTHGIILSYDQTTNTATVAISMKGSESPATMLSEVPCPFYPGLQHVAPEPGRPCLIVYKDSTERYPYITHYMNPRSYLDVDYARQNTAINNTPRYINQF